MLTNLKIIILLAKRFVIKLKIEMKKALILI